MLIPVLLCLRVVVVVTLTVWLRSLILPRLISWPWEKTRLDCVVPVHCVCHEFQTVPIAFPTCATNWSKLPSLLIIRAGNLSTSNHSSPLGVSLHIPVQVNVKTGFKFSTLDAYGCWTDKTSEYGNVIKSPVFW